MRKISALIWLLLLFACNFKENSFVLRNDWSYREIFVDKTGTNQDYLYEFELPLPSDFNLEFPLSDRVKISRNSMDEIKDNIFSFMISPSPHELQDVIYDICSNGVSTKIDVNLELIKQVDYFKIYKIQPACNNSNGYVIEGETSVYNVWGLPSKGGMESMHYAITHIRKNPRAPKAPNE